MYKKEQAVSEGKSEERDEHDLLRWERVTCPGLQGGLLEACGIRARFTEGQLAWLCVCLQPHCNALTARGLPRVSKERARAWVNAALQGGSLLQASFPRRRRAVALC